MKQFEKRIRVLEKAAGVAEDWTTKPWRRVIVEVGESEEEAFAREGIGPDENVIVRTIIDGDYPVKPRRRDLEAV